MKILRTLPALFISASVLLPTACTPPVNYEQTATAGESSAQPVKITADQDSVAGCTVFWKDKSWTYDVRERFALLPNESGIAFMSRNEGKSQIVVKMLSGSCRIFRRPQSCEAVDPAVSPDGKRLSFCRLVHGAWNLYEMDLDGSPAINRITNDPYYNFYPRYFPDGSKLLFCHTELQAGKEKGSVEPVSQLWSVGLGGSSSAVTEYCDGFSPSFVSKTNQVVIVRGDSGRTTELRLVDLITGSDTCIFNVPGRGAADPEVSPSGKMVAFVSMTEAKKIPANLDIYTVNIDGTDLKQRTFFPGQDICPRWSADGKSLYFLSQRGSKTGLWNIWKMQLQEFASAKADSSSGPTPQQPAQTEKKVTDTVKTVPPVQPVTNPADSAAAGKITPSAQPTLTPADSAAAGKTTPQVQPADSASGSAAPAPVSAPSDSVKVPASDSAKAIPDDSTTRR